MSDKDFDFDKIGKATPFIVPDDFYGNMQDKVMSKIRCEKRRRLNLKILTISTISVAAMLGFMMFIPKDQQTAVKPLSDKMIVKTDNMDNSISNMSNEEMDQWMQINESDIFIY